MDREEEGGKVRGRGRPLAWSPGAPLPAAPCCSLLFGALCLVKMVPWGKMVFLVDGNPS